MGGEERGQLADSLPMVVGVEGDIVCRRIRGGPSPPRVLLEYQGIGVKELIMGSGCCRVYPAPPSSARPQHCGSCWALGHHNGLSVGTDGGPFRRGHKTQPRQEGRGVCEQAASMPYCQKRGRTLEVEEGEEKLKRDFRFFLIIMQGRV